MLISIKINNCFIYNNEVEFSMKADMRYKKFKSNVANKNNINILKSAVIFGPNNSGKTNLIKSLGAIKSILLKGENVLQKNFFTDNNVCSIEVNFVVDESLFLFSFEYDTINKEYLYERYAEITYDDNGNKKTTDFIVRNSKKEEYVCENKELKTALQFASKNNLVIFSLDVNQFDVLLYLKRIVTRFASSIEIVDMNNIPIDKTLEIMKSQDEMKSRIVDFVKNADLSLDDIRYASDKELDIGIVRNGKAQEEVLNVPSKLIDSLHLLSVYNGIPVPSVIFDSTGTKKITAIASYIIEALELGKILIIDEVDNSLHFKLTRAIISLFNNELNSRAQLICTVHDVSLLDCKKMFRKEQIWFSCKDSDRPYLYSLSEFKSNKDGVRGDSDNVSEKYKKGLLGALPEPDLFDLLLEVQ